MAALPDDHRLAALGARRIAIDTDRSELVLPPETMERLSRITDWVRQPPFIFREWGLSRYVDGGFRALFCGPSGTGKSMAAVVIARETGLNLLQVDMSAVVSKYIGETEKNLRQLFREAEEAGAILLFDEADALFGKRTGARDSHDRYANVEIAYLLKKIEPFEGVAILATNADIDLDGASLGRIDVLVDFPLPDEAARELLWRNILGQVKLRQVSDLDIRRLAKDYDFSGAEILRSVRMAALLAATAARDIDMALLQSAAKERIAMREASRRS